ncbi:MAG: hypothetical protein Q8O55_07580 [Dehalococcoidales bacterium]|nr:hypothetical protein [Dehalococcoidales bacterium]
MSKIVSTGLQSIIAVGAGVGGAIANAILAIPMPIGNPPQGMVKMVIKKIAWYSNMGVNATLLIGYGDRTIAGSLFRQVLPTITMINGFSGVWDDVPIAGNIREGFMIDMTAVTGTLGDIYIECPTVGIGAAPNNVFVTMDVELS